MGTEMQETSVARESNIPKKKGLRACRDSIQGEEEEGGKPWLLGPGAASYDVDSVSAGRVSRRCRRCRPALQLLQIEVALRILQQAHPVARLVAPRPVVL